MFIVIVLINFLGGFGKIVIGMKVRVVVMVELKRGIFRCCMVFWIVLFGVIFICNCWFVLLIMMIVLLIKSLSVIIKFVIDIWWIGIFIRCILMNMINVEVGNVNLMISVFF